MTYQHTVESTSFESNQFNLGHYLKDNAKVYYYGISYKFNRRVQLSCNYMYAMRGDDIIYNFYNGYDPTTIPIHKNRTWDKKSLNISLSKEIKENIYLSFLIEKSKTSGYGNDEFSGSYYLNKYSPIFYHGKTNTFSVNINIGF